MPRVSSARFGRPRIDSTDRSSTIDYDRIYSNTRAMQLIAEIFRPAVTTRRTFLQGCAALLLGPALGRFSTASQSDDSIISLDQDWLFGGRWTKSASLPEFDDRSSQPITLPHSVVPLSWHNWQPDDWQDIWSYRRHVSLPEHFRGQRIFLHFDRVMAAADVTVNGHSLPRHLGGFLPFQYELTDLLRDGDNVIAVAVDARWLNIPPAGSSRGPASVDYLLPGGITGSATLRALPHTFIRDVVAHATNVLTSERRLDIICQVDSLRTLPGSYELVATLRDGDRVVARTSQRLDTNPNDQDIHLALGDLGNIELWDVAHPHLYQLEVALLHKGQPVDRHQSRIGLRDARFELDGFYLNGRRLQIFGLDRHELYPYVGYAASPRLLRRDAEILRQQFNCNMVRCSHYPQSPAFLDACDELGLLVWEEIPGWQYIGDAAWQECAVRDLDAMVRRDRNRPSVVVWGVRINESPNDPEFYRHTRELAKSLDPTRPTSGTMTPDSLKTWRTEWHQDVFAFDDYHAEPDGSVGILPPLPGVPYLVTEMVGQFNYSDNKNFNAKYRRAAGVALQQQQALRHAQAHSRAAAYPRCAGVIAWCAFDYASLLNADDAVKCPGVSDVFRIPKLGAAFYLAQADPKVRVIIEPNFYWDFAPGTASGLGKRVAIFSNCDRLELFIAGMHQATVHPDRAGFPHIAYPPFFADMEVDGAGRPELRIDGYVGQKLVRSRTLSSDRSTDRLYLRVEDAELIADGADATRLIFGAADKYGNLRTVADGEVVMSIEGPGKIVGDNPFHLAASGGSGAVLVQTMPRGTGRISITATHAQLGRAQVDLTVRAR